MLYCHDNTHHPKFLEMEKMVLKLRLMRRLVKNDKGSRIKLMKLVKELLGVLTDTPSQKFSISASDWDAYSHRILRFSSKD